MQAQALAQFAGPGQQRSVGSETPAPTAASILLPLEDSALSGAPLCFHKEPQTKTKTPCSTQNQFLRG